MGCVHLVVKRTDNLEVRLFLDVQLLFDPGKGGSQILGKDMGGWRTEGWEVKDIFLEVGQVQGLRLVVAVSGKDKDGAEGGMMPKAYICPFITDHHAMPGIKGMTGTQCFPHTDTRLPACTADMGGMGTECLAGKGNTLFCQQGLQTLLHGSVFVQGKIAPADPALVGNQEELYALTT